MKTVEVESVEVYMERWMVHSTHSFISISSAFTASKLVSFVLVFKGSFFRVSDI
jgi:hypothetical protein